MNTNFLLIIGLPLLVILYMTEDSYEEKEAQSLKLLNEKYSSVEWDEDRGHEFFHPCSRSTHFDFKAVSNGKAVSGIVCTSRFSKPYIVLDK